LVSEKNLFFLRLNQFFDSSFFLALLDQYAFAPDTRVVLLIASYGASAVVVFGAQESPMAQPRNVMLGHFLAALVAVVCTTIFPKLTWLAAVSIAIMLMMMTCSLHPPAASTALLGVVGPERLLAQRFLYILMAPFGATILMLIAMLHNNLNPFLRYPIFWV
jgi:CBS-domain-containing membrane protein